MNTHIVGPYNAGYGAVPSYRGLMIDFNTPFGEIEMGTIQASIESPAFVELFMTDEQAFDGTMLLELRAAGIGLEIGPVAAGTFYLRWGRDVAEPYTGFNPPTVFFVARTNYRVYAYVGNGMDNTQGRTTLIVRASGLGSLPIR